MRNLSAICFASACAVLAATASTFAQAPGAANMAWPDKTESAVVFASAVVLDMDRAVKFYTEALGLKRVGGFKYADGYAEDVFLAFNDKPDAVKVTLVKPGKTNDPIAVNNPYTHIVIQVPNIQAVLDRVPAAGGRVARAAHRIEETNTSLATIEDPDGHQVGLLQRD